MVRHARFQVICKQFGTEVREQFTFTFKLGSIEGNAYNFTLIYLQFIMLFYPQKKWT